MANFEAFTEDVQQYPGFVSLLEEGDATAGDPWQEGYSSHNLHVVTQEDYPTDIVAVGQALLEHPLGDAYVVTHHRRADFAQEGHTFDDLSVQFRSKVIVGEDLVAERPAYSKARAISHGYIGMQGIGNIIDSHVLNGNSWSEDRLRRESYTVLSKWFSYNAAIIFGRGETYPARREDVVEHLPDADIGSHILRVTHSIVTAERYEIIRAMTAVQELTAHILYPPRVEEDESDES